MKLDILAIGVHPDDVELGCGGIIASHIAQGYKIGILDLTAGELGTRGNAPLRLKEAQKAAEILGVSVRHNLGMRDGFFQNDEAHQLKIIPYLRHYRPDIVLINAPEDRHPDHPRSSKLAETACFLSGLSKVESEWEGKKQESWRPSAIYQYIQFWNLKPDIIVDIGDSIERKKKALEAYASQFYQSDSKEPETVISSRNFQDSIVYRAKDMGRLIGTEYAEGLLCLRAPGIRDLKSVF